MDPRKAYTANGNFDIELLFITHFDSVPSRFDLSVRGEENELKDEEIKFDNIKHLFEKSPLFLRKYDNLILYSEEETEDPLTSVLNFNENPNRTLSFIIDSKVIRITNSEVSIAYNSSLDFVEDIEKLAKNIFEAIPKKDPKDLTAKVSLIKVCQGDYYTTSEKIRETKINIEENYNEDFIKVDKDIKKFLNTRSSGIILLHGEAGTGKTSYIRHLISTLPKEYVVVPGSIAARLGDPDLITFVTNQENSVFILEDCEQLIEDRETNPFNNAISTILNMSDGLLSDIVNIKFICTFNAEISKVDSALLRKGRCAANYEFKELSADKVKILNDKYNLGHTEIKDMTLAEVYNSDKTDYSETKDKIKIGF